MAITAWEALWFLPFVAPICIWVAWSDLKFMKIRNKAVAALLIVFFVIGLVAVPLTDYPWRVAQIVIVLVAGFLANMVGVFGAGDAKFAAAMAAFVPASDAPLFLILLATVMLAALATHRIFRAMPGFRARTADWASWKARDFPMGLALGGSLLFYLVIGALIGG
jgi:prepilin peptidase CpaA